jgi:hypothetical protein
MLSEMSQTQKDKYHRTTNSYMGSKTNGLIEEVSTMVLPDVEWLEQKRRWDDIGKN